VECHRDEYGDDHIGCVPASTGRNVIAVITSSLHQCCGSGMFTHPGSRIPDPGSRIPDLGSRIPDPKTATKERGEKKLVVTPFYICSHKFHKIVNYFKFEVLKKKIWVNFQRIIELFTKKIVKKL
jgi:hypothetical protein